MSSTLDATGGLLVIADLHLDLSQARGADEFVAWCDALLPVRHLVVLGDLVDAWVGPAHAQLPAAQQLLSAFTRLGARGTRVHLVHGNRDFLLDEAFGAQHNLRVHPEQLVVQCGANRVLLVHGDLECTRDHGYQRLRRVVRSRPVRGLARVLPLWIALPVARRLRRASVQAIASKLPEDKSIQPAAIASRAQVHAAQVVVCGHAHAFRDELLTTVALAGQPAETVRWIVLDAWGGARAVLWLDEHGVAVA